MIAKIVKWPVVRILKVALWILNSIVNVLETKQLPTDETEIQ